MTTAEDIPAVFRSTLRQQTALIQADGARIKELERALLDAAVQFECLETVSGITKGAQLRAIVEKGNT